MKYDMATSKTKTLARAVINLETILWHLEQKYINIAKLLRYNNSYGEVHDTLKDNQFKNCTNTVYTLYDQN